MSRFARARNSGLVLCFIIGCNNFKDLDKGRRVEVKDEELKV
jgi:hypothetical protein